MRKHVLKLMIFMSVLFAHYGKAQTVAKTGFSETWVLNLAKSEFGEIPVYTANKQIKIALTADQLQLERTTVDDAGADSTANETLPLNGKTIVFTGGDHRQRKVTANLSGDGNSIAIRILVSEPDEPGTVRFDAQETWNLDKSDGTLRVKRDVRVTDGDDYGFHAVYDRK